MSISSVSIVQPAPSTRSPTRDPLATYLLTIGIAGLLVVLLVGSREVLVRTINTDWPELAFWAALVAFCELIPVRSNGLRLVVDLSVLLAIALLYPASVAASVAFIGTVDVREVRREISLSRAVFNRAQIALSVFLAGWAFHIVASGINPWPRAIAATALALAVEYVVNVALVLWYITLLSHSARESLGRFSVGRPMHFLATYLGEGVLALVLAHLFTRVGSWSVLAFMIPTLFARQSLIRSQALEQMADQLRNRERLLERLMDRVVDERRDERLRIAADLHDDVLQELTSIWLLAKVVERKGGTSSGVREIADGTESSIESLRRVIHDLKESPVGRGGLVPTLRLLVRDLQLDWKTRVRLDSPTELDLDPGRQILAYQIVREAIINALKHAQANEIRVTIKQGRGQVEMTIEDDGVGFEQDSVDQDLHFGIGLMHQRLQRVNGRLEINSTLRKGTRLSAILPTAPVVEAD